MIVGHMTRIHRGLIARLITAALAASCAVSCAPAVPPVLASGTRPPAPDWRPCEGNAQVLCGTMSLPVDWDRPGGERFDMAVARRPATGSSEGTLVYLPAGPGSSGVDALTNDQIFSALFPPAVAERFDIVGFDPRGVRRSHPVQCDSALVEKLNVPTPTNASTPRC
jgi:hypothetical protein